MQRRYTRPRFYYAKLFYIWLWCTLLITLLAALLELTGAML